MILAYASILYLLLGIFTLCLGLSYWVNIFACCAVCGHCWGQCAHFALIIVTGVFRYSDSGKNCAEIPWGIDEDTTFEDHGDKIQALFISQCVLWCFYNCCVAVGMQLSVSFMMIKFGNRGG